MILTIQDFWDFTLHWTEHSWQCEGSYSFHRHGQAAEE